MAKVAITAQSFLKRLDLVARVKSRLPAHQLFFAQTGRSLRGNELYHFIKDVDAVLIGREPFEASLLEKLPRLKTIAVYGVGTDNIDFPACERSGIEVLVKKGVNADATAEHTIGLILATLRNIASNSCLMHEGRWRKDGGTTLYGKSIAIVGSGCVGSRVAHLAKAMGVRIFLVDTKDKSALAQAVGGRQVALDEAIATADLVSVHLPLTNLTRQLFNKKTFAMMKKGCFFFNCARGEIVDEHALVDVLVSGDLGGAGLDVFASEPSVPKHFQDLPNVVMSPHTAGNAYEAVTAMGEAAIEALQRSLDQS